MAYDSKAIKTDVNAKPIPQYYNPVTDEYEVLQGTGGAARQVLYGPDGSPIATTEGKLAVRAAELEAKLEAVRVLLNALAGEDFATQTTLAQILGKMIAAPATEAKQDVIAGHVDGVETLLTALKEKDFATQATLATVLERLQAVEGKIDGITDGTAPAKTELTGSNVAYDGTHDAIKTVNASLLHESFDFKDTKEVTVSPGSFLFDTYRPTNGYTQARIIAKRIDAAHNWRLNANWTSDGNSAYQVVEKLHTALSTEAGTQTAKIVTSVGSQWVSLQLFNDDAENSHDYHVHIMLTAG